MLGAVQGVAEVVPVSSSAQLTLLPWLLGWSPAADRTTFAAGLHAGSCAGVALALRADLAALSAREVGGLAVGSVPAALAGLLAVDTVERRLGRPGPTAALSAAAGLALWLADRRPPTGTQVLPAAAAVAALAQVAALVPGVSRYGATLTALRACGVERQAASRFSLLMSLPVTAGAAGLTLWRSRDGGVPPGLAAGSAAAAVSAGVVATRLRARGFPPAVVPAVYRLLVAAAVAARTLSRKEHR